MTFAPFGPDVAFDTEREHTYTQGEDGVVRREAPPFHGSDMVRADSHGLRCSCSACLARRADVRAGALADLIVEAKPSWSTRSWDGPLARFPGTVSNDAGRQVTTTKPR